MREKRREIKKLAGLINNNMRTSLDSLCQALLAADPEILEIIQFGSSVYAPEVARDIDLVVVSGAPKDYEVYLDAAAEFPLEVDVVVSGLERPVSRGLALGVSIGKVLFGNGQAIREAREFIMDPPTFQKARLSIKKADDDFSTARQTDDLEYKDTCFRPAFGSPFDAARLAAQAYLTTNISR